MNYFFKQYQKYFWGNDLNKLNQMMGLNQSPLQDNGIEIKIYGYMKEMH